MIEHVDLFENEIDAVSFSIPMDDELFTYRKMCKSAREIAVSPAFTGLKEVPADVPNRAPVFDEDKMVKQCRKFYHEIVGRLECFLKYCSLGSSEKDELRGTYGLELNDVDPEKMTVNLTIKCNLAPFLALDIISGRGSRKLKELKAKYGDALETAISHSQYGWKSMFTPYVPYELFDDFRYALAVIEYAFPGSEPLKMDDCNDAHKMLLQKSFKVGQLTLEADFVTPDTYQRDPDIKTALYAALVGMVKAGNKSIDNKLKSGAEPSDYADLLGKLVEGRDGIFIPYSQVGFGCGASAYYFLYQYHKCSQPADLISAIIFYLILLDPLLNCENKQAQKTDRELYEDVRRGGSYDPNDYMFTLAMNVLGANDIIIDPVNRLGKKLTKAEINQIAALLDTYGETDEDGYLEIDYGVIYCMFLLQRVAGDMTAMRKLLWEQSRTGAVPASENECQTESGRYAELETVLENERQKNAAMAAELTELKKRIEELEHGELGKKDAAALIAEFDEEIEELQEQNQGIQRENDRLQAENQGLRSKLESMSGTDQPVLIYGEEKELFPGEIRDVVLSILNDACQSASNRQMHTRRNDILQDILNANPYEGVLSKRAEQVKSQLTGYSTLDWQTRSFLESIGFQIKESSRKHVKMWYYGDPRYRYTVACSGSDNAREGKNMAQEIIGYFM